MLPLAEAPSANLKLFWWVFAVRGGFALLFAGLLQLVAGLFGTLFFDPIMLVYLSLLLGFYLAGTGIVLAVAAVFAAEHQLNVWKNLSVDGLFAIAFGVYIALSLLMTPHALGILTGIHALAIGVFQLAMAVRLRHDRPSARLLGGGSVISLGAGYLFLTQWNQPIAVTVHWLCYFELFYAAIALAFAWRLHRRTSPSFLQVPLSPATPVPAGVL